MYAVSDRIVTVGEGYKRRLIERGVPADKISIVMNGWDSETVLPCGEQVARLRTDWNLGGKFICAYVGTIGMACGLDIFLRAAKLLRNQGVQDVALVAVGDGALRQELIDRSASDGLESILFPVFDPNPKSLVGWKWQMFVLCT